MHSSVSTLASLGCTGQTLTTKEELNTRMQWQSYVSLEIIKSKGKLFYKGNTLCKVQEMRNDNELAPNHTTHLEKSADVDLCNFLAFNLFLHYVQLEVKYAETPSHSSWVQQAGSKATWRQLLPPSPSRRAGSSQELALCVWERNALRPGFTTDCSSSEPNSSCRATASPEMGAVKSTCIQATP